MHDARRKNNVNRLDVRHNHGVFASCIVYDLGGTYSKMEREYGALIQTDSKNQRFHQTHKVWIKQFYRLGAPLRFAYQFFF